MKMKLIEALKNSAQRFEADFKDSKLFTDASDKGSFREWTIKKFLRPFFPDCYGLGSGQVFDSEDSSSNQVDVVIFDQAFSNVLFRDNAVQLFPFESVYGIIESKSHLNSSELDKAIGNVRSLKQLKRSPSDMMDILPIRRLKVDEQTLDFDKTPRNAPLGVVFCYDSVEVDKIVDRLQSELSSSGTDKNHLPDFVFCWKKQYAILRAFDNRLRLVPAEYNRFTIVHCGEFVLPFFFLSMLCFLNQTILKAPHFGDYWLTVFNEIKKANNST